jgi:hypothetical protein
MLFLKAIACDCISYYTTSAVATSNDKLGSTCKTNSERLCIKSSRLGLQGGTHIIAPINKRVAVAAVLSKLALWATSCMW